MPKSSRNTLKSKISSPVSDKITQDILRFTTEYQTNMKNYLEQVEKYKTKLIEFEAYLKYKKDPTFNKNNKYLYSIPLPTMPKIKLTRPILPPRKFKNISNLTTKNNSNNNNNNNFNNSGPEEEEETNA